MKTINKQTLTDFRNDFAEHLKSFEEKHNIKISLGRSTYNSDSFDMKMTTSLNREDGKSIEQIQFEKHCFMFDLKKQDFGKKLLLKIGNNDMVAKIIEITPSSRKYPIIVLATNGKKYKLPSYDIQMKINAFNNIEEI